MSDDRCDLCGMVGVATEPTLIFYPRPGFVPGNYNGRTCAECCRVPPTFLERVDDLLVSTLLLALLVPVLFVAAMLDPDDFLSAWRGPA